MENDALRPFLAGLRHWRWAETFFRNTVLATFLDSAFTDNFTRFCLAAPHISARAPALREVISLFRILGKRTSKRIQDDGQVLNGQTHAHGAEHHSGGQRVLEVFIDAAQRCARTADEARRDVAFAASSTKSPAEWRNCNWRHPLAGRSQGQNKILAK